MIINLTKTAYFSKYLVEFVTFKGSVNNKFWDPGNPKKLFLIENILYPHFFDTLGRTRIRAAGVATRLRVLVRLLQGQIQLRSDSTMAATSEIS